MKLPAPAPVAAARRLIRTATDMPKGASRTLHDRARTTKSGFPGGWGMPRMCAVAMYSLVSQNAVVGARVTTYRAKMAAPTMAATPYGGRCSSIGFLVSPRGNTGPGGLVQEVQHSIDLARKVVDVCGESHPTVVVLTDHSGAYLGGAGQMCLQVE